MRALPQFSCFCCFETTPDAVCRSAQDGGIDGQLLVDVNQILVLDIVPLADLLFRNTEADGDTGHDVTADDRINDILSVVHVAALRVLLPGAVAAGEFVEFFLIDSHFCFLLFLDIFLHVHA